MTTSIVCAHISDTHLGLRQFEARDALGRNQRSQDILVAYRNCIDDIVRSDPPLIIHSGDVFESPVVNTSLQKLFQVSLEALSTRADGSRRVTVVISGNHDQPANVREPAAIELNAPIAGVHIVSATYATIDCGAVSGADPSLANTLVHAIPHDQLRVIDWDDVVPVEGKINILTTHGVVGGSDLYKRTKGREYAVPADVLTRGWDYVALGHWHKRGPIPVGEFTATTTPAWYAGSIENNDFGEAQGPDGTDARGWLEVTVRDDGPPVVRGHDLPIRAMYTLDPVDGADKTVTEVEDELVAAVSSLSLTGTIVRQRVENMPRDEWLLLNRDRVRAAGAHLMWFALLPPRTVTDAVDAVGHDRSLDFVETVHQAVADLYSDDTDKDPVSLLAVSLLTNALTSSADEDDSSEKENSLYPAVTG